MSGNDRCNYDIKYLYPPQWSLDLCAGPSCGIDKHFSLILFHSACGNLTCQSCFKPTKLENLEYFVNLINTATYCIFLLQKAGSPISGKELIQHDQGGATDYLLSYMYVRADTKISSCQVNTTSRQGIKQLGIFLHSSS